MSVVCPQKRLERETRSFLDLLTKRRYSGRCLILRDALNAPHRKKQISKTDEGLVVHQGANPIIECVQVEAAQEYSSLIKLVEHTPTFFARRMQHDHNRCPAPNSRAGIQSFLHAVFAPAGIKPRTNSPICSTNLSEPDSFSICATIAEPTTAASA